MVNETIGGRFKLSISKDGSVTISNGEGAGALFNGVYTK
jgi:hypothetical protein